MRFTPKSEEELKSEMLLADGRYPFDIIEAIEKVSSKGNDMIVVEMKFYSDRGARTVKDYITDKMLWKLKHLAEAVGLSDRYELGELYAEDLKGRSGEAEIRSQEGDGKYGPKNVVKDYIPGGTGISHTPIESSTPSYSDVGVPLAPLPPLQDDDIPF